VGDFLGQTFWQVDNFDGLKGTSLNAHTATNTQGFRNEANN
jgi:hypothetical protein